MNVVQLRLMKSNFKLKFNLNNCTIYSLKSTYEMVTYVHVQ
jgi:hypothetical protein